MSLTIKEQFDQDALRKFNRFLDRTKIVESGLFFEGIDDSIMRDKEIAILFLRTIALGRADIFNQERVFSWIDKLHLVPNKNGNDEFSKAFYSAMQALCEKTDMRFKRRGYKSLFNKKEASELEAFGVSAVISNGLRQARYIANREAYKHFGEKYGVDRPAHLVDFPARLRIMIKNLKNKEFADNFEGRFEGGATISKINEGLWEINFDDYFLNTHHEYKWNLNLWYKIFAAIKPYLSELFIADITYIKENQFND